MMTKHLPCEALKKIRRMAGAEEMKAFAERLASAASNRSHLLQHFTPPNVLLLANEGAGVTHCLSLLTELMHELLPVGTFIGEEDMFEWCIEDDDASFKRLLLRIRQAGGFYGQFRGVIGLDMRPMLADMSTLPELRRLMTFVREQQEIVFVFIAPQNMKPDLRKALEAELMANTIIETIELRMPGKEAAATYMLDHLHQRGFVSGGDIDEAVQNAAAQVIASGRFAGFRSLDAAVGEVVWRKAAQGGKSITLSASDFNGLAGRILKTNTSRHTSNQRKIGFGQNR